MNADPSASALYPVFLKLTGRRVLVVGGGRVASSRIPPLLACGARITVVAPELREAIRALPVAVERRPFTAGDLDGAWLVVAAATPEVNRAVGAAAEGRAVFVNAVDDPDSATAYTAGVLRRAGITVAVSTEGRAPALAGLLREALEAAIPDDAEAWLSARGTAAPRAEGAPGADGAAPAAAARGLERVVRGRAAGRRAARGVRAVSGHVTLVGAGPGDPELLTLRAVAALGAADIVFYDALVAEAALAHAPRAQKFCVGKRAGRPSARQSSIQALLVRAARRGKRVVRLKGGDPFLFGRGGEEALALRAAGVPFDVVPGVSSALAAPALSGIPVTHRSLSSALVVVSGHAETAWRPVLTALEPGSATLVVLMGLASRAAIARELIARGWPATTPAAVVWGAATPAEAPLARLAGRARRRRVRGRRQRRPGHDRDRRRGVARRAAAPVAGARGCRRVHRERRTSRCRLKAKAHTRGRSRTRPRSTSSRACSPPSSAATSARTSGARSACRAAATVSGRTGDAQMLRVKIPQGVLDVRQLEALAEVAERWSRGFGHVTTRQNVQFHFVRLHDVETVMRRAGGGRPDHPRGLRQHGAQRDGLSVRRRRRRRGVRRDAIRGGVHAALPAPPARRRSTAQVQGRLRGLPGRPRVRRDQRHRLARARARARRAAAARVPRGRRRRDCHLVHLGGGDRRVPAGDGRAGAGRGDRARVPPAGRLRAPPAQPHEVPDLRQLGWEAWKAEVERELETVRAEGGAVLPFDPEDPPDGSRPRQRRDAAAAPLAPASAAYAAWARTERAPAAPARLLRRHRHAASRRRHGDAAACARGAVLGARRRDATHDARPEPAAALGARGRAGACSTTRSTAPGWRAPARARSPT